MNLMKILDKESRCRPRCKLSTTWSSQRGSVTAMQKQLTSDGFPETGISNVFVVACPHFTFPSIILQRACKFGLNSTSGSGYSEIKFLTKLANLYVQYLLPSLINTHLK